MDMWRAEKKTDGLNRAPVFVGSWRLCRLIKAAEPEAEDL